MATEKKQNMAKVQNKARYWTAVCYPENMIDNWQDEIAHKLQLPGVYCIHDKDNLSQEKNKKTENRKTHVHIVVCFGNTTTYNSALETFKGLSKDGACCVNTVENVKNIRYLYDYLIHDTEDAKKKGKYLYPREERITFNNFDIGSYEQLSLADKRKMCKELCLLISRNGICNFVDFFEEVVNNFEDEYFDLIQTYSGLFERLCKGNYHKKSEGEL